MFMSKAQPRATKEYYPPHLTGRGSRGLMALAFELFGLDVLFGFVQVRFPIANFTGRIRPLKKSQHVSDANICKAEIQYQDKSQRSPQ